MVTKLKVAKHIRSRLNTLTLMVALSCCSSPVATGQVIAVVNGQEVTVAELNEEARSRGLAIGENVSLRNALLQDIIDRKLLVEKALEAAIDETPKHILAERRVREVLLAQQLIAIATTGKDAPTPAAVQAFLAQHPLRFGGRVLMSVEYVEFTSRVEPRAAKSLAASNSIGEALARASASGIQATRRLAVWDSAEIPEERTKALMDAGFNKPLLVSDADQILIVALKSLAKTPLGKEEQLRRARDTLSRRSIEAAMRALLDESRSSAEIVYQPGFAADPPRSAAEP